MSLLQLPHTSGCLVCGRENPRGLKLDAFVHPVTGEVSARYRPSREHIGFDNVIHGGLLATLVDELMTWAATWAGKRFCVCGEMTIRLRKPAGPGRVLRVTSVVTNARARLIETSATITDADGETIATATGKYVPMPAEQHEQAMRSFVEHPNTAAAAALLKGNPIHEHT